MFGLVTAVVFAEALSRITEIRVILVGAAYAAGVGLVSWVLYSVISYTGVGEFFSGLTLQGVSTLPLALFMLVVLQLPTSVMALPTDFVRWVLGFVGFAVAALIVWGVDRAVTRRTLNP